MKLQAALPCVGYSIGRRLSWQLALQTIIGLGIVCAGIFWVVDMLFDAKHDEELQTKAGLLQDVVRGSAARGGLEAVREKLDYYAPRRPGTFLELLRADGSVLYRDADDRLLGDDTARMVVVNFSVPQVDAADLKARLVMDCSADRHLLAKLALVLLGATLTGGAVVGLGTFWRVSRGLQPLRQLAQQTRAIAPQRLGERLRLSEPVDELQPWIDQFNALMGRLERAYGQLEGFNADVAHELRTPLATLIGQTELALARERSAEALRDTLSSNLEELQRLSQMVNDMLFLSRADRGAQARRGEPVSLAALARQVLEFHEALAEEAGVQVRVEGDARVAVDEALFKRAVSNLLGNATRFADPGSTVCVRIAPEAPEQVQVTVQNAGPAIDPQSLPQLFDRFFRADASRCDAHAHHGLGLAIVAAIARMHAGRPVAESHDGVTRVGFTLAAG